MASPTNKQSGPDKELCRMITPKFRVSYPHVFKAQAPKPGDKPKYSVTMLFPKDSDLTGKSVTGEPRKLVEVIRNAKIAKYGPKENWPEDLQSPVSDGDDPKHHKKGEKEGYKGHWVIKAISNEDQRPTVVDEEMIPITDASKFYPGCYARAYVYAYAWEYMGKHGIGFILDHVQKMADGKSFGGKKSAEEVFGPVGRASQSDELADDDSDTMDFK